MARIVNLNQPIYTLEEPVNRNADPIKYIINEHGCHICVSHAMDPDGYPRITRGKKYKRGNRFVYSLFHGNIPEGKSFVIMHTCDIPSCINPEHLKLGTHKENMADRQQKGRTKIGCETGRAKLNIEQVYYIRFISEEKTAALVEKYHVNATTIRKIRRGITYPEVTIASCPDLQKNVI